MKSYSESLLKEVVSIFNETQYQVALTNLRFGCEHFYYINIHLQQACTVISNFVFDIMITDGSHSIRYHRCNTINELCNFIHKHNIILSFDVRKLLSIINLKK